tara:strand:- start:681 stop:866 length:186 start_codon:yes stop_codon:yes gene_type:complete
VGGGVTITDEAQVVAEALLELVDQLVTHRVNVITDSDWFAGVVQAELQDYITAVLAEGVKA